MMEAIILAGGLGTRLRDVVPELPKCMAPVSGHPFLYYIFSNLAKNNFTHVILSLGYKHEVVRNWILKNSWPFRISISIESEPLGTGGAIKSALTLAYENSLLILNGDTFFDINIKAFYDFHLEKKAEISLSLKLMQDFERYGNVTIDENNRILAFQEKQPCKEGQINGGIYLINRNSKLMKNSCQKFSFETDILRKYVKSSGIYGFISSGYFIDIGIPEDYAIANKDFHSLQE
jgi:D-glycero-alpha-D-manno-heptose 1-phosphate guanylyltransferase